MSRIPIPIEILASDNTRLTFRTQGDFDKYLDRSPGYASHYRKLGFTPQEIYDRVYAKHRVQQYPQLTMIPLEIEGVLWGIHVCTNPNNPKQIIKIGEPFRLAPNPLIPKTPD